MCLCNKVYTLANFIRGEVLFVLLIIICNTLFLSYENELLIKIFKENLSLWKI